MRLFRTSGGTSHPSIFGSLIGGGGRHRLFGQPAGTRTYRPTVRRSRAAVGMGTGRYLPKHSAPTGFSATFGGW